MTTDHNPVDTAWRAHAAIGEWTARVDTKASFVLTIESGIAAGIVALSSSTQALGDLTSTEAVWLYRIGLAALSAAIGLAAAAVIPQIRAGVVAREASENFIFFGHVRHWSPVALEAELKRSPVLPVLSRQLIAMSEIAWRKHRFLQASFVLVAGAGIALLFAHFLGP